MKKTPGKQNSMISLTFFPFLKNKTERKIKTEVSNLVTIERKENKLLRNLFSANKKKKTKEAEKRFETKATASRK